MPFSVTALEGLPMVQPGDDLAALLLAAISRMGLTLTDGDIFCLAQKIVSKAENRQVLLADIAAGPEAEALAREVEKDPRMVQLVLDESTDILRKRTGALIVRHKLGFVGANAGIDQSNIDHADGEAALLLPVDPDASAARLREALQRATGKRLGVIITDSHNRPWRLGTIGAAIGSAGVRVLQDHRGGHDIYGRELKVTLINRADAIATAATLMMGETTERLPAALVQGLPPEDTADTAQLINRPLDEDLFR
ncbi:MAG: coenzyme F420-0:L-glutamate ligase [Pseudomonadales bacterium]|nr:coenzyme F420-0:L-glutamate ligase [Pseudomonadales bacterium]